MKTALIVGASGLTGTQLLDKLLHHPEYSKITILVRKLLPIEHPKLVQKVVDWNHLPESEIVADDIYSCMGTTIRVAGSQEAQYLVDCTYPLKVAEAAKKNGSKKYILVTAIEVNSKSSNFYLRMKGELEDAVTALSFETFIVCRPSFLYGNRSQFRLGEKIFIPISYIINLLLIGPLSKYHGIHVKNVAEAMINAANTYTPGKYIIEYKEMMRLARS